jgi:hypothetical protein
MVGRRCTEVALGGSIELEHGFRTLRGGQGRIYTFPLQRRRTVDPTAEFSMYVRPWPDAADLKPGSF